MNRIDDLERLTMDNENDLKETLEYGDYNDLMKDISAKLDGNADILDRIRDTPENSIPDVEGLIKSHAQIEAVKNVLGDEEIVKNLDADKVTEAFEKADILSRTCVELEDSFEVFKVEDEKEAVVNTEYTKQELDIKGFDRGMSFSTLCNLAGVPNDAASVHRFGVTNPYAAKGTVDKSWEIKLIPATVEGSVSPFAVGKCDLGDNKELLFVGHVASDNNGKILPKIENIHFINTDNADQHIPDYMKDESGKCTTFD